MMPNSSERVNKMIKTKRFFAVVLCMLISFQCVMAFAGESSESTRDNLLYPDIAVATGILDGDIMGRLDSNITRGELVSAVVRMSGTVGSAEKIFSDVELDHPYAKEITTAYKLGYINGFGDGTFRPDEEATYSQAIKLLVYLAGYGEIVEGGMNLETIAARIKVTSNIRLSQTPAIKVREAAEFLVCVGSEVKALETSGISGGAHEYSQSGESIFEAYLNISKQDGIISANSLGGIYEDIALGDNTVMLGNEKMADLTGKADKLLGYNVTVYVRKEKSNKPEILYAYENNMNQVIKIPASKLTGFDGKTFYYENEKGEDKEKAVKLASVATVYNGVLVKSPSLEDYSVETGSIVLIDNDDNGSIDVIKVEKYNNYIIDSYDPKSNTLWFKFGGGLMELDSIDNLTLISSDNKPVELRELVEWDVVSVASSKKNEIVTITYIAGEVEGTVTAMYDRAEKKMEIDGVAYDVANVFMDNLYDEIYIGQYANFYFDIEGKIASYNLLGYTEEQFMYLIGVESGSGLNVEPKIKLMDEKGEVKILPLADSVEVDGQKMKLKNTSDLAVLKALSPQIFLGKTNSSGAISYIDTANGNDDGLRVLSSNKEMQYKKNTMIFFKGNEQLSVSNKTVYMYVPQPGKKAQDDDYYIQSISGIGNNNKFTFTAYTNGDGLIADAIVRTHNPESGVSFTQDHAPVVVNEVTKAINNRGEASYKISIYNTNANGSTYYTESEHVCSNLELNGESYFPQKGDIIRISTNRYGEIRGIEPVYCQKTDSIAGETNPNTTDILSVYRIQTAYAYKKDEHVLLTTTTKPEAEHLYTVEGLENLELKNLNVYKVCVYDSKEDILTKGDGNALHDFITTGGAEASRVFVYERYLETGFICIYR